MIEGTCLQKALESKGVGVGHAPQQECSSGTSNEFTYGKDSHGSLIKLRQNLPGGPRYDWLPGDVLIDVAAIASIQGG